MTNIKIIYHFNILHLPCINQVHNIQMRFLGYVYIIMLVFV